MSKANTKILKTVVKKFLDKSHVSYLKGSHTKTDKGYTIHYSCVQTYKGKFIFSILKQVN